MACILLIDDEDTLLKGLERALVLRGHEVTTCVTGQAAVQALQKSSFDAVVIDLILPDIDGFEILQTLPTEEMRPKVLVFSGGGSFGSPDVLLRAARQLGANAILEKPVSLREFVSTVEGLLED